MKYHSNLIVNATAKLARAFPKSPIAGFLFRTAFNWYEAGWPLWSGGDYSYLPSLVQDMKWDANYVTRREMLRRMRYWSQNSPIVESVLSVGERYTVGSSGLHVNFYPSDDISEDSDESWYERADAVVKEWFECCGWNDESYAQLLKIAYRDQKVDGEIFVIKTKKKRALSYDNHVLMVEKPCLQLVESHRVESPWNEWDLEGRNVIDGVQFDTIKVESVMPDGKKQYRELLSKTGYWIRNGQGSFEQNDSWYLIESQHVFHLYDQVRANQYRGLSTFYSCGIMINKHENTLEIEMKAHSSQSVRAVGVETASGVAASPLDRRQEKVNSLLGKTPPNPPGSTPFYNRPETEQFRKETGAYVYGLKLGEKIHFDNPSRPSDSTLNLLEYQVNAICAAAHAPRCLVFEKISGASARGQGTEIRAQLDAADAFYHSDFQKWKAMTREVVIWFMEWAIKNDERVSNPPADWKNCLHIQQPAAVNCDVGYTTTANLMNLAAGTSSWDMILGPQGKSAVQVFRQIAREQKMIDKLKIKLTLPALLPGQIPLDGKTGQSEKKEETVTA